MIIDNRIADSTRAEIYELLVVSTTNSSPVKALQAELVHDRAKEGWNRAITQKDHRRAKQMRTQLQGFQKKPLAAHLSDMHAS
jgi:hypothetical protein